LLGDSFASMGATTEVASERVLVSGGAGFVGRHLLDRLGSGGVEVVAPSKGKLDLCDSDAVRALVRDTAPSVFFHLAAFSSPLLSWERPAEALLGNVEMTLNVLEAVRHEAPEATVVLVGSGQVYGAPGELPVTEESPLEPNNPYAVSKASCDMLGHQYAESHGMRVVRMRPFNHAGPGQPEEYVLSSLTRQIAEAEIAGHDVCELRTGNPESARDFCDVRDVVRAYVLAAGIDSGEFNVCSGNATSVAQLVEMASAHARISVRHQVDRSRLRAHDVPVLYGSHAQLTAACGWRPEIPLEKTVRDTLDWWRMRLGDQTGRRTV
jgi:GDP-4-dehydro-6-deoxy-D-mannose reductase